MNIIRTTAEAEPKRELLKELSEKISATEALIERCKQHSDIPGVDKLTRRIEAELALFMKLKEKPAVLNQSHLDCSNLTHLECMVSAVSQYPAVTHVLKRFRLKEDYVPVVIDLIASDGKDWVRLFHCRAVQYMLEVKIIARNPKGLLRAWAEGDSKRERNLLDQAGDYLDAALENLHVFQSPNVIFDFQSGVPEQLVPELRQLGIQIRGDIVSAKDLPNWVKEESSSDDEEEDGEEDDDDDKEYGYLNHGDNNDCNNVVNGNDYDDKNRIGSDSSLKLTLESSSTAARSNNNISDLSSNPVRRDDSKQVPLNLDITVLIALSSNLTNGHANYRFQEDLLNEQSSWERERPVRQRLLNTIKDRELICCQTAYAAFRKILETVGGPTEHERAEALLKSVRIVPDALSRRAQRLKLGGKIKERSKTIFGCGDYYKAQTVTANRGFVHAASHQGVDFAVIIHESRALSEKKQAHATPL